MIYFGKQQKGKKMETTKDIRLNAEKRKILVQHYENHLRSDVSNKFRKSMIEAKKLMMR